mgnify:CR=1 FL=1
MSSADRGANMSNVSESQMFPVSIGYQQMWQGSLCLKWQNAAGRGYWSVLESGVGTVLGPPGGRA